MRTYLQAMLAALALTAGVCFATPSTLVWIPSTDIQGTGRWHFGVDDLINLGTTEKAESDSTVIGLTYGVSPSVEVGLDYLSGSSHPLFLNAKYGFGPFGDNDEWSAAVGGYNFGTDSASSPDLLYGIVSYTAQGNRFHLGYFHGDGDALVDPVSGAEENDGLLLGWDRSLNDDWWVGVDYQGGDSSFGATSAGVSRSVGENSSILLGANFFNSPAIANTLTIQFDLDF